MGAGASAETCITKSDALMAVHEAFHGKGDGSLSIQDIVTSAPAPSEKKPMASQQDWSAMLRAPPDPSVAARYAADNRKTVNVPERLRAALQDEGAMFRLTTHMMRKMDSNRDGGLTLDEFAALFNQIDPDAPRGAAPTAANLELALSLSCTGCKDPGPLSKLTLAPALALALATLTLATLSLTLATLTLATLTLTLP